MFIKNITNSLRFATFRRHFKKDVEYWASLHANNWLWKDIDQLYIDYMAFYEEIMTSLVRWVNFVFKLDWYDELSWLSDDEIIKKVRNYERKEKSFISKVW